MNKKIDKEYEIYLQKYSDILKNQLKEKETLQLFKIYNSTNKKIIKERIIIGNLRFVYRMVWKFAKENNLKPEEIESYGYEGLIEAVNNYDYNIGHPFSNHAIKYIKESLKQAKLKNNNQSIEIISTSQAKNISDKDFVEEIIKKEELNYLLSCLKNKERKVIEYRFGITDGQPHLRAETAEFFNYSREKIRQIEIRALRKMQEEATKYKKTTSKEIETQMSKEWQEDWDRTTSEIKERTK